MKRLAGVALAAALLIAACGGSAGSPAPSGTAGPGATPAGTTPAPVTTTPPSGTAAPSGTVAPSATTAPSGVPGSPSPGSSSGPTTYVGTPPPTPHADPALEAKLPDAIRAVALTKSSFSGSSMPTQETDQTKPTFDLLARLGKKPADLAFAVAADPRLNSSAQAAQALPIFMIAYQVQGVSGDDLLTAILAVAEKYATSGVEKGTATLNGQTVQTYVDKSVQQAGKNYLVSRGGVLYVIQTTDETLAAEALAALP